MDYFQNNYAEYKKPGRRVDTVWIHLYKLLENANTSRMIESLSVVIWGCGGMECGKKIGALWMRCGETFASDGYVPFFDCVDSFMDVYTHTHTHTHTHIYLFQNLIKLCSWSMCSLSCQF